MKEIVMRHGPTSSEAQRRVRLPAVVSRVQLPSVFLVVADMVLKPTSDDPWTLLVLAAILVAAAAAGAWTIRKRLREAGPVVESRQRLVPAHYHPLAQRRSC